MAEVIILCYHKVGPAREEGRRLNIEPSRLRTHIRYFARRSKVVLARDLVKPWPERSVCFTFDDAYESAVDHAPSILESDGVRGVFYAVSDLVGKTSAWDGVLARPLADWDALSKLQADGHEIGNHTTNHPRLQDLAEPEQVESIHSAQQSFHERGIVTNSFCYPYGSIGSTQAVEQAGYRIGLALEKRIATTDDPLVRLPRIIVAYSDALPMLLYRTFLRPKLRRR